MLHSYRFGCKVYIIDQIIMHPACSVHFSAELDPIAGFLCPFTEPGRLFFRSIDNRVQLEIKKRGRKYGRIRRFGDRPAPS